ncbi:MAG: hypothetical protein KBA51_02925 [Kiritimatiellae bacterium]|nr:hypothetical protein [Kiritimatiellia bacterium]
MSPRDFMDDDLVPQRGDLNQIRMGPGGAPAGRGDAASPGPGDLDLPLMTRHKQQMDAEAAQAAERLERLRQAQEDLERKKRELEEARRKQMDFIKGKQDLVEHLSQSLATLERNELRATQMAEAYQNTRRTFRGLLDEISAIDEESWNDANVREEISLALGRINEARMEYNKSMARIEAMSGTEAASGEGGLKPVIFEEPLAEHESRGFRHWLVVGLAVSLPLAVVLCVLFAVAFVLLRGGVMYN